LFCWIKPGVFGTAGNRVPHYRESWSIAKLMRLFPGWDGPPSANAVRRAEFVHAKSLIRDDEPAILEVSSLEDEMEAMCMPWELRNLFRRLLVVHPDKRPSAADVLASREYQALEEKARAMTVELPSSNLL